MIRLRCCPQPALQGRHKGGTANTRLETNGTSGHQKLQRIASVCLLLQHQARTRVVDELVQLVGKGAGDEGAQEHSDDLQQSRIGLLPVSCCVLAMSCIRGGRSQGCKWNVVGRKYDGLSQHAARRSRKQGCAATAQERRTWKMKKREMRPRSTWVVDTMPDHCDQGRGEEGARMGQDGAWQRSAH